MSSLAEQKTELRRAAEAARDALSPAFRAQAGQAAAQRLCALGLPSARVALFSGRGSEIDPAPLEAALEAAGARAAYPRVQGRALRFAMAWRRGLVPGVFGLLEPPDDAPAVDPAVLDWILVPGLVFASSTGHRVGYGKGYFDRALAPLLDRQPGPLFVGYAFEAQLRERVPQGPHDVPVDLLVTEARALAFSDRGRDFVPPPPGTPAHRG